MAKDLITQIQRDIVSGAQSYVKRTINPVEPSSCGIKICQVYVRYVKKYHPEDYHEDMEQIYECNTMSVEDDCWTELDLVMNKDKQNKSQKQIIKEIKEELRKEASFIMLKKLNKIVQAGGIYPTDAHKERVNLDKEKKETKIKEKLQEKHEYSVELLKLILTHMTEFGVGEAMSILGIGTIMGLEEFLDTLDDPFAMRLMESSAYRSKTLEELIKIANELDQRGLVNEANLLDSFITKLSSELDDPESSGELIDLEEYRRRAEEGKPKPRKRQDPEELMENWKELQKAIDEVQGIPEEDVERWNLNPTGEHDEFYLVVFDDGETYSGDASIVKVKPNEMQRIEEGEKVFDVIPPDHLTTDAKWFDIWDIVKSTDLSSI